LFCSLLWHFVGLALWLAGLSASGPMHRSSPYGLPTAGPKTPPAKTTSVSHGPFGQGPPPSGQGLNQGLPALVQRGVVGGGNWQRPHLGQQQQMQPQSAVSMAEQMRFILQQRQQQQSQGGASQAVAQQPVFVAPADRAPPVVEPPPPNPELEALQEAQRKAAELRRAIERNEGYFEPHLGQVIRGDEDATYTVIAKEALGVGVFSVVWPCADKENKLVALKVVRHQDHFRRSAEKEVQILRLAKQLSEQDPEGAAHVALLRGAFIHKATSPAGDPLEYLCMSFEKLESNLRSVGRQPLDKCLRFSKQIFRALRFLHDTVGIVHCDVKPDNLLMRWDGQAVKLADFGTARTSPEIQAVDELQPLFYRAPEVFIGATRGRKIDVWSAALTVYELVVGRILFRNCHNAREVLETTMQHFGP
ncbi:unnamed protein product, partial [Polarella glacialis]